MERLASDCVNVFCELSGYNKARVGAAPTPFIDEANDPLVAFKDLDTLTPSQGGSEKGKKKKKVASVIPSPGGSTAGPTGKLSTIAVKVLMKICTLRGLHGPTSFGRSACSLP